MMETIDLSKTIVLGHDLKPVPHENIDEALQSIEDMTNSYDLVGPAKQIPSSTARTSSSCTRETISQNTQYSLESSFINGPAFFPKKTGLSIQITMHDPQHRRYRRFDTETKAALLPVWASLIPVFAKSVLMRAKACSETLDPSAKHQVLSSSYEAWATMGFPEHARINSSLPSPLGPGYIHFFIDEHKWRHVEHHFLMNLPSVLCLRSVSENAVKIVPLKIPVPIDMDPVEKMSLLAKYATKQ